MTILHYILARYIVIWEDVLTSPYCPQEPSPPGPEESFAWKPSEHTISSPIAIATSATTRTSSASSPSNTRFSAWNGTSHFMERKSSLPPSQSPTVTLLQKDRGMSSCVATVALQWHLLATFCTLISGFQFLESLSRVWPPMSTALCSSPLTTQEVLPSRCSSITIFKLIKKPLNETKETLCCTYKNITS